MTTQRPAGLVSYRLVYNPESQRYELHVYDGEARASIVTHISEMGKLCQIP